jgi:cyanophycin synthetase
MVGVTGTHGTSLVARLIGCLYQSGKHVGVANREGLFLDSAGAQGATAPASTPASAC